MSIKELDSMRRRAAGFIFGEPVADTDPQYSGWRFYRFYPEGDGSITIYRDDEASGLRYVKKNISLTEFFSVNNRPSYKYPFHAPLLRAYPTYKESGEEWDLVGYDTRRGLAWIQKTVNNDVITEIHTIENIRRLNHWNQTLFL